MYDMIIIGAGAAGMASALYGLRNGKKVLVLEGESLGGQIATSPRLENYPSIKVISGDQFADKVYEQITDLGAEIEIDKVTGVKKENGIFTVTTEYGEYQGKTVIIASGVKHKHIRTKSNTDHLVGKGVYYCAICDGAFYKGKEVIVIGDANTALQYSLLLSGYCTKVHVYTWFDKFFGDAMLVKALRSKENIIVHPETQVTDFIGDTELKAIEYIDKKDGTVHTHEIPAVFVAIGQIPDNKMVADLVDLDKDGYIIADETCKTKTEGLFVAGDCRTKPVRQVITALADGAVAATNASIYLENLANEN